MSCDIISSNISIVQSTPTNCFIHSLLFHRQNFVDADISQPGFIQGANMINEVRDSFIKPFLNV